VGVFEVCLELPSDLKDQFGFVAGEFSELEHTRQEILGDFQAAQNLSASFPSAVMYE